MIIKIVMLVVFFAVLITVGVVCHKTSANVEGFVLGGRSVGPWLTAFAYGTSYFSAVIFVGYAGQFGWKFGVSSTWVGIGNAIIGSLLAWVLLARRTRLMTHKLDSKTMPDFFAKRYDSKSLRIGASVIIFIFLIPYTASLYNGLSRLFGMAFDVKYEYCILAMAILTAIYVIAGGYMATAINDFIQGLIMLIGIVAVIVAVLNVNGGLADSLDKLSDIEGEYKAGAFTDLFGPKPLDLLFVVILTSLGTWGLPQMVQKFYAIKDEKAVMRGTIISTVFAVIVAGGCYFLGGFGRLFVTGDATVEKGGAIVPVAGFDSIVPEMLTHLSDILIAVVVILVLSASMSTLSSLVLTSSSTLTLDFIGTSVKKDMNEKQKVTCMRVLVLVFIAISAALALYQYNKAVTFIAQMMGVSWGALAGSFLAPFLFGLYWKGASKAAVWVNFILAASFMTFVAINNVFELNILNKFADGFFASPINSGAIAMLAGFIIVPAVSAFTGKPEEKKVKEIMASVAKN